MKTAVENFIKKASEPAVLKENEYIDEKDGLIHCSMCHEPLQTVFGCKELGIEETLVRCVCKCRNPMNDFNIRQKQDARERERRQCFKQEKMFDWTFANDDRATPKLSDAMQKYVKNFTEHRYKQQGLLFHGSVGTGKTFYTAAIANSLIDAGYTVRLRTFREIEKEQWNAKDKEAYIDSLIRTDLLILDDLGVERDSQYMYDIVFDVIDTRYKSGRPFLITTNLPIAEIKKPEDVMRQRIYDRILETCFPIEMTGQSRRRQNVKNTFFETKERLGL